MLRNVALVTDSNHIREGSNDERWHSTPCRRAAFEGAQRGLWIAQGLLALTFVGTAIWKVLTPIPELAAMMPWMGQVSPSFLYATALFDLLGGLVALSSGQPSSDRPLSAARDDDYASPSAPTVRGLQHSDVRLAAHPSRDTTTARKRALVTCRLGYANIAESSWRLRGGPLPPPNRLRCKPGLRSLCPSLALESRPSPETAPE